MILAAAQTIPFKGNIEKNTNRHIDLVNLAAQHGQGIVVFPELSLTGYEPELAAELAFKKNDPYLDPLRSLSGDLEMIIVAGAPVILDSKLHIATFVILPDGRELIYTKHYLHSGEEKVFDPGRQNPTLALNDELATFAICADISNPQHILDAAALNATLYLAGVFITPNGIDDDMNLLQSFARQHNITVLMSNFGGPSGKFLSAGNSTIWTGNGDVIAQCSGLGEGLAIARKVNGKWSGSEVTRSPHTNMN